MESDIICGMELEACVCELVKDHSDPIHRCSCTGAWEGTVNDEWTAIHNFPMGLNMLPVPYFKES